VTATQEREDWLEKIEKRAEEPKLKEDSLESVKRDLEINIKALKTREQKELGGSKRLRLRPWQSLCE
jgi:hypothetical protein